ncbi:hypothetical protein U1Q18_033267, partial [Sarracenia purpurea var. burkii]
SLMLWSLEAKAVCRSLFEKATEGTSLVWSMKRQAVVPTERSQRRSSSFHGLESATWPSDKGAMSWTKWAWPVRRWRGRP